MTFVGYETEDLNILSNALAGALANIQKVEGTFEAGRLNFATQTLTSILMANYEKGERTPLALQYSAIAEFLLDYTMKPEALARSQEIFASRRPGASVTSTRRPLFGTSSTLST